jgi:glycosyltransferase involved in cell wall biosynthesis
VKRKNRKVLLVFHTAYTYQIIKDLGLEIFVTARNSAEVFDLAITVNPLADLQTYKGHKIPRKSPGKYLLDDKNIIIEGYSGRFSALERLPRLNFLIAQLSLIAYLIKRGYLRDVKLVRGEDPRFNGVYAFIFSRILRVPLIIGLWGNPGRLRKLNNRPVMPRLFKSMSHEENFEKYVLNHANLVLAQNSENISYAQEAGVPIEKTAITPLGIGIDACHFAPPDQRPDFSAELHKLDLSNEMLFVCISRLESIKMVDHAIRASALVSKSETNFKLIIVGEGRDRELLENLAIELGLGGHVIFVGNKSQVWISALMPHVYLNIAPLCGRSLLEASLSGCPAVAYDVDWHGDIVLDGFTGYLSENLDYQLLAKNILKLMRDLDLRQLFGENMRKLALSVSDPEILVKSQEKIYKSLL